MKKKIMIIPGGCTLELRLLSLTAEEWKVRNVQLVIDRVLNNILQNRGPPGHLVSVFRDPFFPSDLPNFFAISLKKKQLKN